MQRPKIKRKALKHEGETVPKGNLQKVSIDFLAENLQARREDDIPVWLKEN